MKGIKTRIKEMKKDAGRGTFRWFVLNTIEQEGWDNPEGYINDVVTYGCINGAVSHLTYTSDIHKVFDRYYYDIEEKIEELKEELGEIPNRYDLDVKTLYVFIAFEETVRDIGIELGLDV